MLCPEYSHEWGWRDLARSDKVALGAVFVTVALAAVIFLAGGANLFTGPYQGDVSTPIQRSREAYQLGVQATQLLTVVWRSHQLLSWKWWVNLGLSIIPWLVWLRLRPKASTHRLLYVALIFMIISSFLDLFGVSYGLWRYHVEVIPTLPTNLPWNYTLYPVAGMLFFQLLPGASTYLKALLFGCIAALIVEPLFVWLQFYEPVRWSTLYSLPLHAATYLIAHWFGMRSEFRPL